MEVTSQRSRLRLVLFAVALVGHRPAPPVDEWTAPRQTLQAIGRRLSQSNSEHALTVIASREDLILERLKGQERAALAHGYLRFRVDTPVVVDVAVPAETIPFWIGDLGFRPTDLTLENSDCSWTLYRKTFGAGVIGLGINGLDRRPLAHYAVFVRPVQTTAADPRRPVVQLDSRQTSLWKITLARAGVSAANDTYKPFESLPAELIDAILIQPAHGARHSALLATGRVWKTHVVSSSRPDQVVVGFGSDPGRELVWTWRTSAKITSSAIRIARAPESNRNNPSADDSKAFPGSVRVVNGDSTPVEATNLLNDAVTQRHHVVVDGLQPDTVYQYSLGDGTPGGWGSWETVKTAPDSSRGARFLYLGDAQTGLEGWGRLLKAASHQNPDIDCVLLAGDLVDRGNERTNWDHFFLRGAGVFDRVPLMPCVGNHEYLDMGPRLYRAFFDLPRNGPTGIDTDLVYQFECGNACMVVLDSTLAVCDPAAARRQANWLDATLTRSKASWKFVMFHHPVYPSHPWRDSPAMREHWVPIFDKHHVDLVLQGHDHAYQRTYPLRGHRRVDTPGDGTIYVIAVSGDKFVEQAARDYVEVGRSGISTYQTIEIDSPSNRLTYRARTEDGTIVDELQIEKALQPRRHSEPPLSGPTPTIAPTLTRAALAPGLP
ncbi:MAG TPA: metallophosphoesterase family protein [Isosphaeraceae bacterium]|nr:metallophosphoesterase family protein [Isosphaeraceae bacterium]